MEGLVNCLKDSIAPFAEVDFDNLFDKCVEWTSTYGEMYEKYLEHESEVLKFYRPSSWMDFSTAFGYYLDHKHSKFELV